MLNYPNLLGLAILYRLLSREPFGKLALSGNLCFQLVAAIKTVQCGSWESLWPQRQSPNQRRFVRA
jgi:hypothetical protein